MDVHKCYFVTWNLQWLALMTVYLPCWQYGSSHARLVGLVSVPRKLLCLWLLGGCVVWCLCAATVDKGHAVNHKYTALLLLKATFFGAVLTQSNLLWCSKHLDCAKKKYHR
jgi:hypothetical protein